MVGREDMIVPCMASPRNPDEAVQLDVAGGAAFVGPGRVPGLARSGRGAAASPGDDAGARPLAGDGLPRSRAWTMGTSTAARLIETGHDDGLAGLSLCRRRLPWDPQ